MNDYGTEEFSYILRNLKYFFRPEDMPLGVEIADAIEELLINMPDMEFNNLQNIMQGEKNDNIK